MKICLEDITHSNIVMFESVCSHTTTGVGHHNHKVFHKLLKIISHLGFNFYMVSYSYKEFKKIVSLLVDAITYSFIYLMRLAILSQCGRLEPLCGQVPCGGDHAWCQPAWSLQLHEPHKQ